jgi:hypothetical protein
LTDEKLDSYIGDKMDTLEWKKALKDRIEELGGQYVASTSRAVIWSRESDYVAHSFKIENGKAVLFWGHYDCTRLQAIDIMLDKTTGESYPQ